MAVRKDVIEQLRDQVRNPRNRLEVHGLVHRMNGFPIYSREEVDELGDLDDDLIQVGEVSEPVWEWERDLTPEDKAYFWLVLGTVQQGIQHFGSSDDKSWFTHPRLMSILIEEYGIACWHYPLHRRPEGATSPPFECLVCQSLIVPNLSVL